MTSSQLMRMAFLATACEEKPWRGMPWFLFPLINPPINRLMQASSKRKIGASLTSSSIAGVFSTVFWREFSPFPLPGKQALCSNCDVTCEGCPLKVPFTSLKIKHLHSEVPPSESLRCLLWVSR